MYFIIWVFRTVFSLSFMNYEYFKVYSVFLPFYSSFREINRNSNGLYSREQKSIQLGVAKEFSYIIHNSVLRECSSILS